MNAQNDPTLLLIPAFQALSATLSRARQTGARPSLGLARPSLAPGLTRLPWVPTR